MKFGLFIALLSLSIKGFCDGQVVIPEQFNLLSINEQPYEQGLLEKNKMLSFTSGTHKVTLQYEVVIEIDSDEHEVVKSQPFDVKFRIEDGKRYVIHSPYHSELDAAQSFAKKPDYQIRVEEMTRQEVKAIEKVNEIPTKALDNLKHWWLQASDAEKAQFKKWMKKS
ncbi:DUF2057 family protein [Pleionea sp. CnH1-48]|uniref:DUF2057 family protein n=1 Tax=Pleionea sp. CnH1-48 TaxID=2954494 RepID=UPI0020975DA0|nr:DUF2057 family protein [Pleionea sp. CnH1-48]MCO7225962.1 DUF2057 domain-containing protein [Pleionea sp. CnH1-48]